jgi:hypothetical protein
LQDVAAPPVVTRSSVWALEDPFFHPDLTNRKIGREVMMAFPYIPVAESLKMY